MRIGLRHLVATALFVVASALPVRAELIVNGGFEAPTTGAFTTFWAGSPTLPGWTVLSGSVDVVYTDYFRASEGKQSLDLNGVGAGAIEQAFATTIGETYTLSFQYANNPGAPSASANVGLSGAGASDLLSQDISHAGSIKSAMNYVLFTYSFVANSTSTTLRFTSLNPSGNNGIALDAVSVTLGGITAVPEPSSLALLGLGLAAGPIAIRRHRAA